MMKILLSFLLLALPWGAKAQQSPLPSVSPIMLVKMADGTETDETGYDGGAPLRVRFEARPQHLGTRTALYEWRFVKDGVTRPFLVRYDENTDFLFRESGSFSVRLLVSFVQGTDTINYEMEEPFRINISESNLEMPNAFTPNGDGINDVLRAKEGHKSLVEFKAVVVNRWGKKMAEWSEPSDGWDGRNGGADAPDGAYYLIVKAKGADGRHYNIKKTISLLRKYRENGSGTSTN